MTRRALFVDGDPLFGRALAQDFESRAFTVAIASSAEEAVAEVAAHPPDLVVLDLYLPEGASLKLLRLWKAQLPAMVVILVSGHASLSVVVDALKEGARTFFTKPVSAAALLDELEERKGTHQPFLSPLLAKDHRLGSAALQAEGVDRFFAISPGLLSVAGFDGFFKMLNPAWEKVLGYTIDELCERPYLELVHPDDREKATDEALEISGGQTVFRYKNRYRCKNGTYRWLAWSAAPSPAHALIYASARDVTTSVHVEQGLRESNKWLKRAVADRELMLRESAELGQFKEDAAAAIIHDLKNPLSVIVANYRYLLDGFDGPADCREALRDVETAGNRMLRLLTNLADVARLESGALEVRTSEVALSQLVSTVAEERRRLARERTIDVVLTPGPEIKLMLDADLMTRTLENLFDNALRHTPPGGTIELDMQATEAHVELRIGNSGLAVPVASREKIFDKYVQSNVDIGRLNLGLGLYFCRLALEAHGGTIWVEGSERLPTIFGIRLPRRLHEQATATPLVASQ